MIARTHPAKQQWYQYVVAVTTIDARNGVEPNADRAFAEYVYDALNTHGKVLLFPTDMKQLYRESMYLAAVAHENGFTEPTAAYLDDSEARLDSSPLN